MIYRKVIGLSVQPEEALKIVEMSCRKDCTISEYIRSVLRKHWRNDELSEAKRVNDNKGVTL